MVIEALLCEHSLLEGFLSGPVFYAVGSPNHVEKPHVTFLFDSHLLTPTISSSVLYFWLKANLVIGEKLYEHSTICYHSEDFVM